MKRLILCCDGTWNTADHEEAGEPCPSNVVKLALRIAKRAGDVSQIIFYDQGVGTGNSVDKATGGTFGCGLEDNIHDAYRFLLANYEPGDEIYLFGFSRGAFTARSTVGMIRKCGILQRKFAQHYRDAITLYRKRDSSPDSMEATQFRKSFSVNGDDGVPIKFLGVWDTVGALGIPARGLRWFTHEKYQFHDMELSQTVEFACHALAIDEHRAPFEPSIWSYNPKPGQTVDQVWFCGAHSDIGGGYAECRLSDIALDWMIQKAQQAGLGFDNDVVQAHPLQPDPLGKLHNSKTSFYRLTPGIDRKLGQTQSLHPSVLARWDADAKYRPKELRRYLQQIGDPRGAAN